MTNEQFIAVEKFANDLSKCYSSAMTTLSEDTTSQSSGRRALKYANDVIDIQVELARLECENQGNQEFQDFVKKTLKYAMDVIDIQVELARLECENQGNKEFRDFVKKNTCQISNSVVI